MQVIREEYTTRLGAEGRDDQSCLHEDGNGLEEYQTLESDFGEHTRQKSREGPFRLGGNSVSEVMQV